MLRDKQLKLLELYTMNYLDIQKSIIISSPAGSGKTEKLARRYIALLKSGVAVERILAITFTDKAAAEMKQRILRILREEDENLFKILLEKMSLMRVSTIHSFCGTLLRRFSFEASIDPNYKIEDAIDSRISWEEILYEILMEAGEGKGGHEILFQTLGEKGFRGLEYLKTVVNNLFEKRPFSLVAEIPDPPFNKGGAGGFVEELRKWPGAGETVEGYEELFEKDAFNRLLLAEKYFLTGSKVPRKKAAAGLGDIEDYQAWALRMFLYWRIKNIEEFIKKAVRIREIFKKCFARYSDKKSLQGILDFSDLEYKAYRLLTENPEWANILYAFDEKTDHILVDEFQDINNFQWAIIDRLTEEWRSGKGAKREEGVMPTIFLVGDEKQSIYFFRGANIEIFQKAKEKLGIWLKDEFYYEEVRENFRSCQAIIDFTNHVFSKIMEVRGNAPSWITRYSSFEACRKGAHDSGRVEIILLNNDEGNTRETKQREADIIAKRIQALVADFQIIEKQEPDCPDVSPCQPGQPAYRTDKSASRRPCNYMDMAVLLRRRTHLKRYEEAFRQYNIPFVMVKGIGFYQEPEVAILRAFVRFLSNPKDDYSLYILLKSPFFLFDERMIIKTVKCVGILSDIGSRESCGASDSLFAKLKTVGQDEMADTAPSRAVMFIEQWLADLPVTPVSELIEKALVQTKAWEYFHEPQRRANVKKFIRLVEDLEAEGKSLLKIVDFLDRTQNKADEPKANVDAEGMNAVRIMTIHGAKGLEYPIVFIPGIEEDFILKTHDSLIYDNDGNLFLKYVPEPSIRKQDEDFLLQLRKEEEEQKRLFYVAVTRAEDALFLVGQWREQNKSFLGFLHQGLGLQKIEDRHQWKIAGQLDGFSILSEQEVNALYRKSPKPEAQKPLPIPQKVFSIEADKPLQWKAVTDDLNIKRRHGRDWVILGDVFHRLFEGISKGAISESENEIQRSAAKMLAAKGTVKKEEEMFLSIIKKDITRLRKREIWQDIILPKEHSFSELPFILESEKTIYSGRIDRVIKNNGTYNVYDYKTFPADEKEIEYLLNEYSSQLRIYRKAVEALFKVKGVKTFIVFTHRGEIREVV